MNTPGLITASAKRRSATHPPVVCRAVVKLRDDLLTAVPRLGFRELELGRHQRESSSIIIRDVDLQTKSR